MPGRDDELDEEERRRRQEQAGEAGGRRAPSRRRELGWCDGCDFPGCDLPDCDCGGCDFLLLRVSTLLAFVALVVPVGTGGLVAAWSSCLRGYRRWLTRFTPRMPVRAELQRVCAGRRTDPRRPPRPARSRPPGPRLRARARKCDRSAISAHSHPACGPR